MKALSLNISTKLAIVAATLAILSGSDAVAGNRAARRLSVAGRGRVAVSGRLAVRVTFNHASAELLAHRGRAGYYRGYSGSRYGYETRYYGHRYRPLRRHDYGYRRYYGPRRYYRPRYRPSFRRGGRR